MLVFGLLPLVFAWFTATFGLDFIQVLWLIEIYFCLFWALYFYSIIRPTSAVWHRAVGYALFTALIGIPILLAIQRLPIIRNLYAGVSSVHFLARLTGYVFGVGILEETCPRPSPLSRTTRTRVTKKYPRRSLSDYRTAFDRKVSSAAMSVSVP